MPLTGPRSLNSPGLLVPLHGKQTNGTWPLTVIIACNTEQQCTFTMTDPTKLTLPTVGEHVILSLPAPRVLMVKMNRPKQLNAMSWGMEQDMAKAFDWYEQQPSLWCAILTGNGRGFCAGQVGLWTRRRGQDCIDSELVLTAVHRRT